MTAKSAVLPASGRTPVNEHASDFVAEPMRTVTPSVTLVDPPGRFCRASGAARPAAPAGRQTRRPGRPVGEVIADIGRLDTQLVTPLTPRSSHA